MLSLSPDILRQDLKVIFSLVQKRRMIKSAGDLLTEAVQRSATSLYVFIAPEPHQPERVPDDLRQRLADLREKTSVTLSNTAWELSHRYLSSYRDGPAVVA